MHKKVLSLILPISLFIIPQLGFSKIHISPERSEIQSHIFGWINAEAGISDGAGRYSGTSGKDRIGVQQLAIGAEAKKDNIKLITVLGADALSDSSGSGKNIGIKDAFIVIDKIADSDFSFSFGAQPLLFGLKPNGFPGDRSLQASLEYGATGAFNVAQQDGPSAILNYARGDLKLDFGLFDADSSGTPEGTSLSDNFFIKARTDQFDLDGFYGVDFRKFYGALGYERRHVEAVGGSRSLFFAGLGYKQGLVDISYEFTMLDKAFNSTADDDNYHVVELTIIPCDKYNVYIDYATSSELKNDTYRVGSLYKFTSNLSGQVEYSWEDLQASTNKPSSLDFRLQFTY